jgi:tRNA wybutosine-synthesizing protein 3
MLPPDSADTDRVFDSLKTRTLNALDKSPKGSIDSALLPLLEIVNSHRDHFSTSCCSGRIAVYLPGLPQQQQDNYDDYDDDGKTVSTSGKGGGRWLFVSHESIPLDKDPVHLLFDSQDVPPISSLDAAKEPFARLKFEPLVRIHFLSIFLSFSFCLDLQLRCFT